MYKFYECRGCGDILIDGKEGAISLTLACECPPGSGIQLIDPDTAMHVDLEKWAEQLMNNGNLDREKVLRVTSC